MSPLDICLAIICGVAACFLWKQIDRRTGTKEARRYQLDSVSLGLLNSATRLLPKEDREIYREEWFMVLCDLDTPEQRMKHAADLARAAVQMRAGDLVADWRSWLSAAWAKVNLVKRVRGWLKSKLSDEQFYRLMLVSIELNRRLAARGIRIATVPASNEPIVEGRKGEGKSSFRFLNGVIQSEENASAVVYGRNIKSNLTKEQQEALLGVAALYDDNGNLKRDYTKRAVSGDDH